MKKLFTILLIAFSVTVSANAGIYWHYNGAYGSDGPSVLNESSVAGWCSGYYDTVSEFVAEYNINETTYNATFSCINSGGGAGSQFRAASADLLSCPVGTFYYPDNDACEVPTDCGAGVSANFNNNQCPVEPPPTNPECDPPAVWNIVWNQCTVPRSCPDGTQSTVQNPCVPDNNCPDQSDQAPAGSIAIQGESKCANGCVAQYTRNNDGSGTGSYLYSGGSCNDLGDGCHEEEGAALVCGFNPENEPPTDPKPNPNDPVDPLEPEHPNTEEPEEPSELPNPNDVDCESLTHYYYDSSNPEHSPPSAAYAKCPEKVHDQNPGVNPNEPLDCADLEIWNYSSTNPYTPKPPPEYDDCPSRINDTSPLKKQTDDLCKEGQICDTTFASGQENICDKAPICIEEDNFQCVTLRMQWEFMCLFELEEEDKTHTGDERKLDSIDANYFKSIEQGGASETVDVSDTFLGAGDGWGWSRVCPAPPSFTFNGQTFDLDNYYFCLFLEYAGNLMVLFSLLGAGRMMFT